MRVLTEHKQNAANEQIDIQVVDEPGQGGANHEYIILHDNSKDMYGEEVEVYLSFQDGPIKENGVNGITHEALLAIVIDRLRLFQNGDYKCRENANALTHIEEALMWLHKRTRNREARDVEGTNET